MDDDDPRLGCVVLHHPRRQRDGFIGHVDGDVVPLVKPQRFKFSSERLVLLVGDRAHVFMPQLHAKLIRRVTG